MEYIEEQIFEQQDYAEIALAIGDYEGCRFMNCNFTNSQLSEVRFIQCEFVDCNLSGVLLHQTSFQGVKFKDCKMLGIQFGSCNEFLLSFEFEGCTLNHSSFLQSKIRKTLFKDTQLQEVDFSECDLSEATFDECDLNRTIFEQTIIEKTDFSTSYGYSIDPEMNRMKGAIFSQDGIVGLLEKYNIEIK